MGVNAVVIVENSQRLSLEEFGQGLRAERWGAYAWNGGNNRAWESSEWQGKHYFSWVYPPRISHLDVYRGSIDRENPVQLTFLKVMLAVERLAGGPMYVDNDVVCPRMPDEANLYSGGFWLPIPLDELLPDWREVERVELAEPRLVF